MLEFWCCLEELRVYGEGSGLLEETLLTLGA